MKKLLLLACTFSLMAENPPPTGPVMPNGPNVPFGPNAPEGPAVIQGPSGPTSGYLGPSGGVK